ncbi:Thiamin pyrophosphokinase, catalytic region [Rubrobacter xylanophilus DSM 9941]|mgnify:CR=1 FL=1|uniref:Thiamin pyrophosphokinase, catalytic region n=1 Tax=Rubrobacter xylanophilus (strain DSM 9941 / JCM 11954 / NBRC 16129 / PRD-1) TaxID=266117 RepID=Q1AW14_RUBXD|nr:putative cytokinetic ring protein SteA [Rubrobacter xylanophilus]ABG04414.1 Thiamin pyrophosphokinase, catalytic region [Rubrobacter xylanophilus DSM 9941]
MKGFHHWGAGEPLGGVRISGRAVPGRRTKRILPRLGPGTIPIVDHENLDRLTAEALVESGVPAVVNAAPSANGAYPSQGALILARAGVYILDGVGRKVFERVSEGDEVELRGDALYCGGRLVAAGERLDQETAERRLRESRAAVGAALERFARNTVSFMREEQDLLFSSLPVPGEVAAEIRGRHVLVVVRGYDYREDLAALRPYLRDLKPYIIAVDGGADALLEAGWRPDLVFGDMDSVSEKGLAAARRVLVHAYPDGRCPGAERVRRLGIERFDTLPAPGLSEDVAILIADQCGAELVVAVGTHVGLVEFLDKGREGASSTFLTRLKVGPRLVDAKGVSKLYPARVSAAQLAALAAAGLFAASAVVYSSDRVADIFSLLAVKLRLLLGI